MTYVVILPTDSKRICAIRLVNNSVRLLLINVYMPYENSVERSLNFYDELSLIENLAQDNQDCHVIVGGDFNVDFSRNRLHTAILEFL